MPSGSAGSSCKGRAAARKAAGKGCWSPNSPIGSRTPWRWCWPSPIRRAAPWPDAFHAVFRDRLAVLARAHDALRRDGETGTTLEAVAREALAPYGAGRAGAGAPRVVVVGPEVRL